MTPNQLAVLEWVRECVAVGGFSPTIRDIAKKVGVSVTGAHRCVDALVEIGALKRVSGAERGLTLGDLPDLRGVPTDVLAAEFARRGVTLASLSPHAPVARGHQPSCAADSCGNSVQRGHLMCRPHWLSLPRDLQLRILRTNAARDRAGFERAVTQARDLIYGGEWRRQA